MHPHLTAEGREYPPLLRQTPDYPQKLFYRGLPLNPTDIYIAVVGTRHPSIYGQKMAEKFSRELAQYGVVIVSGLAYGIDAIAHEAALQHHPKKRTIAVLGSDLDNITPHCNRPLAKQIQETGTILTEYEAPFILHKGAFPKRNRIIAGMSLATLVIEAPTKSGALITARLALDYNRDVFAVPANLTQESSLGTNYLLRDAKAHVVTSARDIIAALETRLPPSYRQFTDGDQLSLPLPNLLPDEQILYDLIVKSPISHSELIQNTHFPASKISSLLSMLELKGVVQLSGPYILTTR